MGMLQCRTPAAVRSGARGMLTSAMKRGQQLLKQRGNHLKYRDERFEPRHLCHNAVQ